MPHSPSTPFWKQNKRAIIFLGWFLGVYVVGNVLYGLYIQSQYPRPDVFTKIVAQHTSLALNILGYDTRAVLNPAAPTYLLQQKGTTVVSIYEGCNALNVMIVFVGFILALGGPRKKMKLFIPLGLLTIYVVNLFRVGLLFWVAQHYKPYFYYLHKYIFTAIIYAVVLVLWGVWVKISLKRQELSHV